MCAPEVPQVVEEQECGPTRDPPQPASIDMGPSIGNDGGPNAADDMKDVPHHPNVYVTDVPPEAPERRNRKPRPATIDPLPVNIDPLMTRKRLNVYATDVPRDLMWRDGTPFQI